MENPRLVVQQSCTRCNHLAAHAFSPRCMISTRSSTAMLKIRTGLLSGLATATFLAVMPGNAQARFYIPEIPTAAPLIEQAACRTVKTRTRVGGRVVTKTIRRCTPRATSYRSVRRCTNVRTRVRTPAGTFVYRTVRRCR